MCICHKCNCKPDCLEKPWIRPNYHGRRLSILHYKKIATIFPFLKDCNTPVNTHTGCTNNRSLFEIQLLDREYQDEYLIRVTERIGKMWVLGNNCYNIAIPRLFSYLQVNYSSQRDFMIRSLPTQGPTGTRPDPVHHHYQSLGIA